MTFIMMDSTFQDEVVEGGSSINHVDNFFETLDPPLPLRTILRYGHLTSLHLILFPYGLWITPRHMPEWMSRRRHYTPRLTDWPPENLANCNVNSYLFTLFTYFLTFWIGVILRYQNLYFFIISPLYQIGSSEMSQIKDLTVIQYSYPSL